MRAVEVGEPEIVAGAADTRPHVENLLVIGTEGGTPQRGTGQICMRNIAGIRAVAIHYPDFVVVRVLPRRPECNICSAVTEPLGGVDRAVLGEIHDVAAIGIH